MLIFESNHTSSITLLVLYLGHLNLPRRIIVPDSNNDVVLDEVAILRGVIILAKALSSLLELEHGHVVLVLHFYLQFSDGCGWVELEGPLFAVGGLNKQSHSN